MKRKKDTLLIDSFGNKLYEGDTIEWVYEVGVTDYSESKIFESVPFQRIEKRIKNQILEFKVSSNGKSSGYFLDYPSGISANFMKVKPTYKKINF